MLRLLCLACFSLILLQIPLHAQEVLDGAIAGVVDKEIITFSQLRECIQSREKQLRETWKGQELVEKIKELRAAGTQELVERTVILQEAKAKGVTVPEAVVSERIQSTVDQQFGGDQSAFRRWLASQGYTPGKYREEQRDDLIIAQMRQQAREGATGEPEASQKEQAWLQKLRSKAYIKIY